MRLVYNQVFVFRFAFGGRGYGFFVEVMGNNRNKERRLRVIKDGGAKRANDVEH
jgi:hypothetical protein